MHYSSLRAKGELKNAALQLGAEWRWTLDDSCTHFIYQVFNNEIDTVIFANNNAPIYVYPCRSFRKYNCVLTT